VTTSWCPIWTRVRWCRRQIASASKCYSTYAAGQDVEQKYGAAVTNRSPTTQWLCGTIKIYAAAACFGRMVTWSWGRSHMPRLTDGPPGTGAITNHHGPRMNGPWRDLGITSGYGPTKKDYIRTLITTVSSTLSFSPSRSIQVIHLSTSSLVRFVSYSLTIEYTYSIGLASIFAVIFLVYLWIVLDPVRIIVPLSIPIPHRYIVRLPGR
jgi:hypothetical protein